MDMAVAHALEALRRTLDPRLAAISLRLDHLTEATNRVADALEEANRKPNLTNYVGPYPNPDELQTPPSVRKNLK